VPDEFALVATGEDCDSVNMPTQNKSLELSPKASYESVGLLSLWFFGSDAAAQLNSMLCIPWLTDLQMHGAILG
jgi:hypothetical protein